MIIISPYFQIIRSCSVRTQGKAQRSRAVALKSNLVVGMRDGGNAVRRRLVAQHTTTALHDHALLIRRTGLKYYISCLTLWVVMAYPVNCFSVVVVTEALGCARPALHERGVVRARRLRLVGNPDAVTLARHVETT